MERWCRNRLVAAVTLEGGPEGTVSSRPSRRGHLGRGPGLEAPWHWGGPQQTASWWLVVAEGPPVPPPPQ